MKRCKRVAVVLPVAAGLALACLPAAAADAAAPPASAPVARAAPPACDVVQLNKDAFALGHKEGLKDGRADGFEDAYRQSYDDAFKKKQPGLTADQCEDLAIKAFQEGYAKGYETGFADGRAKGSKEGQKEGKEDRKKGNASRNVVVEEVVVTATPKSGETDCSQGIRFTAQLVGTGPGTVQFHWERKAGGKVPGTVEFAKDQAELKSVTDQAAVPAGSTSASISQKFVVDSGPSKGKSALATANVTCKK
ncbi:hypothetical protein ACIPW5_15440 [Streptomyces sp. NPDC090077]|uniref:hypothetical protein n=1 Tax=Streptomyces sp. NPDC090077 TaxID=3365938 RepID=UPI003800CFE3